MAGEIAALAAMSDADIDTTDISEILDWSGAVRGRFYRPVKRLVTIRLDADVIAWFKSNDSKYQPAINRALRAYILDHIESRRRDHVSSLPEGHRRRTRR